MTNTKTCTIQFLSGALEGLVYHNHPLPNAKVGQIVRKPVGGSPYKVLAVDAR